MAQTYFHRGDGQIVERAIFEPGFARRQEAMASLHRRKVDRASRKPRPLQLRQRGVSREETPDTCWIPEHLVERDAHEIRPDRLQIEVIGRYKRRRVEEHIPTPGLGLVHEVEG